MDFSSQLFSSKFGIVVPVKITRDMWSFLHPFSHRVWAILLLNIPVLMLTMVLADYLYLGSFVNWKTSVAFVMRVTFRQRRPLQRVKIGIKQKSNFKE